MLSWNVQYWVSLSVYLSFTTAPTFDTFIIANISVNFQRANLDFLFSPENFQQSKHITQLDDTDTTSWDFYLSLCFVTCKQSCFDKAGGFWQICITLGGRGFTVTPPRLEVILKLTLIEINRLAASGNWSFLAWLAYRLQCNLFQQQLGFCFRLQALPLFNNRVGRLNLSMFWFTKWFSICPRVGADTSQARRSHLTKMYPHVFLAKTPESFSISICET